MGNGRAVVLSPKQAEWMGREVPSVRGCDGCRLFGACVYHTSEWGEEQSGAIRKGRVGR